MLIMVEHESSCGMVNTKAEFNKKKLSATKNKNMNKCGSNRHISIIKKVNTL